MAAWTEQGVQEVAPGVWRIPLSLPNDGLRAVNVYAVRDGDGLTLVDGGWALDAARRELAEGLDQLGAKLPDIRRFLVTHAHRDHYTNAVAIRREFGTTVLLGAGERPSIAILTAETPPRFSRQLDRLARHGAAPVVAALEELGASRQPWERVYEVPDGWIEDRQEFPIGDRVLEAIATPGHTKGHVVFADYAAGLLFAGDHVLPHITPSIGFEPEPPPLALRDYLGSLRTVRGLPDLQLLPAHGPAGGRSHARIDELLAHHAARLDEMAQVLRGGARPAYDVAEAITWTRRHRRITELDPFNQMLAVFETVLHLELLVAQGAVVVHDGEGLRTYALAPEPSA